MTTTLGAVGEGLIELTLSADGREQALGFGGDAANVCVMASRFGTPTRLAARVGDDALGSRLLAFWREQRIDIAHVLRDPRAPTGLYVNDRAPACCHPLAYWRVPPTRFRPDTRLDRGGHDVGYRGGSDGGSRRRGGAVPLRRAGRPPGGRPGGALERAAQGRGGPPLAPG